MIGRHLALLHAAFILTLPPLPARAQDSDSVRLTVQIVDARSGQPLPGAVVELSGIPETFPTALDGRVSFVAPVGTYVLVVRRTGYERLEGNFRVWQPGSITLNMQAYAYSSEPGRLTGTVVDGETREPVEGAAITFGDHGPMITDGRGRFAFEEISPGSANLDVQMMGYEDRSADVTVEPGRTTAVRMHIATQPIELAPILVEVRSRFLEQKGVYQRMERGVPDRLVTRADLELRETARFSDTLDGISGLNLVRLNTRAILLGRSRCLLRVFMDGVQMQPDMDGSVDIDQIPPEWVEVAEVYSGIASVPAEYGGAGEDCGVMLIWSRQRSR